MSDDVHGSDTPARLVVVAVGGNALITDKHHVALLDQANQAAITCEHIADVVAVGWRVVVTHGNGPQVGFILHQSELAKREAPEVPLVYAVAETQGAIGFMLQQGLTNALTRRGLPAQTVTVVTRVTVDPDDPSFQRPDKPIGIHVDEVDARALEAQFGWSVAEDAGRGWRRVVASPQPLRIVEQEAIERLLAVGHTVIAAGGGGVPVVEQAGRLTGVDAVIDKDATSSLLARQLGADVLLVLTDVPQVVLSYGTPEAHPVGELTAAHAEQLLEQAAFAAGSMAPKVGAAVAFARSRPGATAIITDPASAVRALQGHDVGTRIADHQDPAG